MLKRSVARLQGRGGGGLRWGGDRNRWGEVEQGNDWYTMMEEGGRVKERCTEGG